MNVRKIHESEREEIENYLMLDETTLYSLIAPYIPEYKVKLHSPEWGSVEESELRRKKFNNIRGQIHKRICSGWDLCNKIDDKAFSDTVNLVVIVGDAISAGAPPSHQNVLAYLRGPQSKQSGLHGTSAVCASEEVGISSYESTSWTNLEKIQYAVACKKFEYLCKNVYKAALAFLAGMFFVGIQLLQKYGYVSTVKGNR